jgi:hypothetical protein
MMFYVGQKVVCVDADEKSFYGAIGYEYIGTLSGLKEKEVYTVSSILIDGHKIWPGVCICLEEIKRGVWQGMEIPFSSQRFRPIVETDISIFEKMLVPMYNHLVSA